ncbi:MAG: hypothetical protein LBH65_03795 [Desulfovibrio sp.]|nr:hypothetical protein [Desulfovibrio sp.]
MNKRSVPIAIVSCILALAGLAGYFTPAAMEAEPARLLMENPGGRVVFTHNAHSAPGGPYGDIACADCHHELKVSPAAVKDGQNPGVKSCTACHGSADSPAFVDSHQELYRPGGDAACVSCHHGRMAGYSSKWSHDDHWTYAGDDCQSCHHPERYEARPGKFMNIKPQKCRNCHTARPNPMTAATLKDAAHAKCRSCHEDLFEAGANGCAVCHNLKSSAVELAEGTFTRTYPACGNCHAPISGALDAFHGNCMTCHDANKSKGMGKGPGKAAPCGQCHAQ